MLVVRVGDKRRPKIRRMVEWIRDSARKRLTPGRIRLSPVELYMETSSRKIDNENDKDTKVGIVVGEGWFVVSKTQLRTKLRASCG